MFHLDATIFIRSITGHAITAGHLYILQYEVIWTGAGSAIQLKE